MIALPYLTFIIPLKVEHPDRLRNARATLGYLNHHFRTCVILHEVSADGETKLNFLPGLTNLTIHHLVERLQDGVPYHRTRYLNEMLEMTESPVVCNYDIDVVLPPVAYVSCCEQILRNGVDLCYPYAFGHSQYQVAGHFDFEAFGEHHDINLIINNPQVYSIARSEYGHCMFLNTSAYRQWGGENEEFVSYGPEDQERGYRFQKLTQRVSWLDGPICHFEHHRGTDSGPGNPHFRQNTLLFDRIKSMPLEALQDYYLHADYRAKYRGMCEASELVENLPRFEPQR